MPQARFCIQAVFLFTFLIFCMVQLFRQVEDKAVYIALLSAICGNTVPTIKQKKPTKSMIESQPFIARDTDFDEVDSPRPNTNRSPCVVKL